MATDDFSTPVFSTLHATANVSLISSFEAEFGHDLPQDYRAFLLETNGVKFLAGNAFFPRRERWEEEHTLCPQFIPPFVWPPKIGESVSEDLMGSVRLIKGVSHTPISTSGEKMISLHPRDSAYGFTEYMPAHLLVIGWTFSQELLCMECAVRNYGAIYAWEPGALTQEEALASLSLVADNFQQFWDGLVIVE